MSIIAERLSARQLFLRRISAIVCMYVCMHVYICMCVLRNAICNLIPLGHFEMIMGLDMNDVMDNNWVLFAYGVSSCPFCGSVLTATSMHTKPHLLNARARGLHCVYIRISSLHYVLDTSTMKPSECHNIPMSISP